MAETTTDTNTVDEFAEYDVAKKIQAINAFINVLDSKAKKTDLEDLQALVNKIKQAVINLGGTIPE